MGDLRVLHVDDARTWRGGEQQVLYLHRGLVADGVASHVVCQPDGALHDRLRREDLPHTALAMRGGHDLAAAWRLGNLVHAQNAIVHAHTSHAHDLALWASRLRGRFPLIVSRRVDFPIRGALALRKYRSRRIDRYLSISSGVRARLEEAGVDPTIVRDVASGIDFSRFEGVEPHPTWRAGFALAPDELLVGNIAALAPHKDQSTLLRAFAALLERGGRAQLVILGEGELRDALTAERERLGLVGKVHLPGFAPDILPRMLSLDVYILSSNLEGLGTATLDAMALGVPVVATRTGGIPDAVLHEKTGLLAPPNDPPALAEALLRMTSDASLRRSLATAAREHVKSFDARETVRRTLATYRELV